MTTLQIEEPLAKDVKVSDEALIIDLADGRTITVPLSWYPRVFQGNQRERNTFVIEGGGHGIHWPELDEDISIEGVVAGRPSKESAKSLQRWIKSRASKDL